MQFIIKYIFIWYFSAFVKLFIIKSKQNMEEAISFHCTGEDGAW